MAIFWSDTVRNATLEAWEAAIGTSARIRIYAGAVPAHESASLGSATLLAEFSLGSDWATAASGGEKVLAGLDPSPGAGLQTTATATGTATFYRIYASNGSTCHEQGTVGTSGADLIVDNTSIALGQTVRINQWKKIAPH